MSLVEKVNRAIRGAQEVLAFEVDENDRFKDGKSFVFIDMQGETVSEFYQGGGLIRISTDTVEKTFLHGKLHSYYDNPALIEKHYNRIVRTWYHHGIRHRTGKPAVIISDKNVAAEHEFDYYDGDEHGPLPKCTSMVCYIEDGVQKKTINLKH